MEWHFSLNSRQMPWKYEKNPYKIWLSEVILQQTRVEQGISYYNNFIKKYPTIQHLAASKDTELFKLWEGLGYYSRCKNLLATAKNIVDNYQGKFPESYAALIQLKGIGPYTASAIASFAFKLPHAVVDGNVNRVLSRFFGISNPIDSTDGKKIFSNLADELLDKKSPDVYNQAIMDFGATICKPKSPLCHDCILSSDCYAFHHDQIAVLPVKGKKLIKKERWFYYFIIEYKGQFYINKRDKKDIWQGLHEFVMIESNHRSKPKTLIQSNELFAESFQFLQIKNSSKVYKQQLTHQTIHAVFIQVKTQEKISLSPYIAIAKKDLRKLAFPKIINQFLDDDSILE